MSTVSVTAVGETDTNNGRIPSGKLGVWWFIASEIMTFGGLLGSFVLYRFAVGGWGEEMAHVNTRVGALNTLILLSSSLTMVQAHAAVEAGDRKRVSAYLLFTVLLGCTFLGVKGYEYSGEIGHGFLPSSGLFWSFYYGMTGLHALHVLGGIVANLILYILATTGRLWPKAQQRVEYAGLYWHFVDIVWIFLFPLLYLS